jgi:hypothetical protein
VFSAGVLAGFANVCTCVGACATEGALAKTVFWELLEHPARKIKIPVDPNKKTFFIAFLLQKRLPTVSPTVLILSFLT